MRYDLMDCHICVCSPEVLLRFSDEFDYQEMREHFVKGVLSDLMEDNIYDYKIHAHILDSEYAARVTDLRTYDAVSRDIIRRWVYPVVPENNLFNDNMSYQFFRGGVYKETNVQVDRASSIGTDTVIGAGTVIGARSSLRNCVVGRNVTIGANVEISGSYIWDGAVIADGCTICSAVLCNDAQIGANAQIREGAVIGYGCVIGPDFVVERYHKLTVQMRNELPGDDDDDSGFSDDDDDAPQVATAATSDPSEVGKQGMGRLWVPDDPEADTARCIGSAKCNVEYWRTVDAKDSESSSEEEADGPDDDESSTFQPENDEFHDEAIATIMRGCQKNIKMDNVSLEITSLKLSYNKTFGDCANAALHALLKLGLKENPTNLTVGFKHVLAMDGGQWKDLLEKYLRSAGNLDGKQKTQVELICSLEQAFTGPGSAPIDQMSAIMLELYNEHDLLDEDCILAWAEANETAGKGACKGFLQWLEDAEEESDEDEESEE